MRRSCTLAFLLLACCIGCTTTYGLSHRQAAALSAASSPSPSSSSSSSSSSPSLRSTPYISPFGLRDRHAAALGERTFDEIIKDALKRHQAGTLRRHASTSETEVSPSSVDVDVSPTTPTSTATTSSPSRRTPLTPSQEARKLELARAAGFEVDPLPPPPEHYDPRKNATWGNICPSVTSVRDQGNCDADWAAAVASAFSDRLCIQTNGTITAEIAIEDILSCCGWHCGLGCNGGYSAKGWEYIQQSGAVSGGDYNTSGAAGGCLPYSLPPCQHFDPDGTVRACDAIPRQTQTPTCTRTCQNGHEWELEKHYAYAPQLIPNTTGAIEAELYYHGSVTATMDLYQDFLVNAGVYRSIYSHREGTPIIGSLTIKLIGYGHASWSDTDFWIATTTWGEGWSQSGGFFLIARGTNECNIENTAIGAMIRLAQVEGKIVGEL